MDKYIESKYVRERYAEIGFELTDFQKATIIWNKHSLTYNECLEELAKICESTSDMQLKEQIKERIAYEKKVFARLKESNDENVVYIVKTADDLYGVFTKFDTALLQAKKIVMEEYTGDEIRIEKHLVVTGDEVPATQKMGPFGNYTESYLGYPIAYVELDKNGEIIYIVSEELCEEEKNVDHGYNRERFEFKFFELPYVHIQGLPVKNVVTGEYGIMATDKKEWDEFLDRVRNGLNVDYIDVMHTVYCLTESGYWSHEHWNPLYIEVEMPDRDWFNEKQRAFERAMEAFSDYMSGYTQEENAKLVVRTAREYALVCNKMNSDIISEDAKIDDILQ